MRRSIGSFLASATLACAALGALPRPANAQDSSAQAAARALFDDGVALMAQNRLTEACPKLEASLEQFAGLGTRGKLAECYEKAGRLASAWRTYKEVARLAGAAGDTTREKVAGDRAQGLESRLAFVAVVVPTPEIPGLVVKRNGKPFDQIVAPEAVDAGLVQIEASAPGRRPFTIQVMASSGQTSRVELPTLDKEGPATPAHAAPPPARTTPHDTTTTREPTAWQKPLGLALGGTGLVALAVGGIVGLSAKSTYDGAFDSGACDKVTLACTEAGQKDTDSARSSATAATVLTVAGAALAVGGAVLWFTAPTSNRTAVRLAPAIGAGQAGLVLGGTL